MNPDISVGKISTCNAGDPGSIPGSRRSSGEGIGCPLQYSWASLVAQLVKNPPAMQETWFDPWVRKIPWRRAWNPLQYSCLEDLMHRGTWRATVYGVAKSGTQLKQQHTHDLHIILRLCFNNESHFILSLITFPSLILYLCSSFSSIKSNRKFHIKF